MVTWVHQAVYLALFDKKGQIVIEREATDMDEDRAYDDGYRS